PGANPTCAVFTPDGKMLIAAWKSGVYFYETEHWTERSESALTNDVGPIAISLDGSRLATSTARPAIPFGTWNILGAVHIWDTATLTVIQTITNAAGPLVFSPDSSWLATDSPEGITLWPLAQRNSAAVHLENSSNLLAHTSGYQHLWKTISF